MCVAAIVVPLCREAKKQLITDGEQLVAGEDEEYNKSMFSL